MYASKAITNEVEDFFDRTLYNHTKMEWFIIYDDDGKFAAIGGLDYSMNPTWIGPSFVQPEYRGRGLQRLLIELRKTKAKSMGIPKLQTTVTSEYSKKNMLEAGFVVDGYKYTIDLTEE